jgi:peptide/nickel transport system permease protein
LCVFERYLASTQKLLLTDLTPSKRTWQAFKRNKIAIAGLVFITLTLLAAILGYLIMPDQSPHANNMTIQLSIKKPGSSFMMLRIRKSEPVDTVGFFTRMPEIKAYNIFEVVNGVKPRYHYGTVLLNPGITVHKGQEIYKRFYSKIATEQIINRTFWLGTDIYGRDMLSRLLLGTRISLAVGLMSVIISMLLGVTIGAIAGYFGGWIDNCLSWLMNILWSLPALLLVIAISFALGKGLWQIFIAVGLSMWVEVTRMVRGQVMGLKRVEYIEAAGALGFNNTRIITRHILPNITGPILVLASSNFASAILLEAGLSFLGFGAQPPMPTWGGMIKEHYGYIVMNSAYLAIIPGVAIMLLVYAFNLVTVGLRDAFDIKSQSARI